METEGASPFTVVLEATEPFGPEVQVLHEEACEAREAALRALHHWHNQEFAPTTTVEELEDNSVRVLAVLEGRSEAVLTRGTSQELA
jgi:hypothetical protein